MSETLTFECTFLATPRHIRCLVRCSLVHVQVDNQLLLRFPLLNFESMGAADSQPIEAGAETGRLGIVEVRFHFEPTPHWSVQSLLLLESCFFERSYFQPSPLGLRFRRSVFPPRQSLGLLKFLDRPLHFLLAAPFLCRGFSALPCFNECCFRFDAAAVFVLLREMKMWNSA